MGSCEAEGAAESFEPSHGAAGLEPEVWDFKGLEEGIIASTLERPEEWAARQYNRQCIES